MSAPMTHYEPDNFNVANATTALTDTTTWIDMSPINTAPSLLRHLSLKHSRNPFHGESLYQFPKDCLYSKNHSMNEVVQSSGGVMKPPSDPPTAQTPRLDNIRPPNHKVPYYYCADYSRACSAPRVLLCLTD